ncbi:MAG: hypothetical protein SGPRY_000073 [Prymnesium sp.]
MEALKEKARERARLVQAEAQQRLERLHEEGSKLRQNSLEHLGAASHKAMQKASAIDVAKLRSVTFGSLGLLPSMDNVNDGANVVGDGSIDNNEPPSSEVLMPSRFHMPSHLSPAPPSFTRNLFHMQPDSSDDATTEHELLMRDAQEEESAFRCGLGAFSDRLASLGNMSKLGLNSSLNSEPLRTRSFR